MSQLYISRAHVRKSLIWAATARTWMTIAAAVAVAALIGLTFQTAREFAWAAIGALVVVPLVVWWTATQLLCRRAVECPACKGSLWEISTGNFLPQQIKLKDNASNCPHCGAVII